MLRWIAGIAAALAAATGATAQPGPPGADLPLVERPEPAARVALFISPSGQPFRAGDGLADWFAAADRNGDTLLTQAEFRLDAEQVFRSLDADEDGVIDGFENQTYEREVAPEIGQLGGGRDDERRGWRPWRAKPPIGQDRMGAARFGLLNIPQPVRNADADLSGRVSWAEWGQTAERRFQTLDEDGDGVLTLGGLRAFGGRTGS